MKSFSMGGVKLAQFALGLTLAATLAACGGGGGSSEPAPVQVASTDTTAAVTSTSVAALVTTPSTVTTFSNGFNGLSDGSGPAPVITGLTTVAFSGTAPAFTITNGGDTATGVTTFGSCIFTVSTSTFPGGSPLAAGKVVKVNPCNQTASTSGANADGTPVQRDVVLVLGEASSEPVKLAVTVNADGTVLIGTTTIGTVTLTAATGAGS